MLFYMVAFTFEFRPWSIGDTFLMSLMRNELSMNGPLKVDFRYFENASFRARTKKGCGCRSWCGKWVVQRHSRKRTTRVEKSWILLVRQRESLLKSIEKKNWIFGLFSFWKHQTHQIDHVDPANFFINTCTWKSAQKSIDLAIFVLIYLFIRF